MECPQCGATVDPFMKECPRCRRMRQSAAQQAAPGAQSAAATPVAPGAAPRQSGVPAKTRKRAKPPVREFDFRTQFGPLAAGFAVLAMLVTGGLVDYQVRNSNHQPDRQMTGMLQPVPANSVSSDPNKAIHRVRTWPIVIVVQGQSQRFLLEQLVLNYDIDTGTLQVSDGDQVHGSYSPLNWKATAINGGFLVECRHHGRDYRFITDGIMVKGGNHYGMTILNLHRAPFSSDPSPGAPVPFPGL